MSSHKGCWWIGSLGVALTIAGFFHWKRNIWFFRDPPRRAPGDPGVIVAPCDGQVIYIQEIKDGQIVSEKLGTQIFIEEITKSPDAPPNGVLIGIYMSPYDVHFNYAPISGRVRKIVHAQVQINLPMVDLWEYIQFVWFRRAVNLLGHAFHLQNERNTIVIEGSCKVAMVEIADKVVNKIDCYVHEGEELRQGQKVSFIKRGSQVDLILWETNYEILAEVGQHVLGAITPLARILSPR
ncbi:MAG: phosphatidylserine decarboxylase [Coprothermobacterota bacterium]|nr:phosphatidylserine decarboxylase [Coprothermobacterota bacterium]